MRAWYEETGNKCERLLPPGRPLEEARELLEREDAEIGDLREFIQASIAKETARQEEERRTREAQQHKELALAKRLAEEEAARADAAETLAKEQAARVKATKEDLCGRRRVWGRHAACCRGVRNYADAIPRAVEAGPGGNRTAP